jgi:hypothetical protein
VAKPNYGYEKRQRELEKKKKKAEKALKKSAGPDTADTSDTGLELDTAAELPDSTADLAAAGSPAQASGDAPSEGVGSTD